MQSELEWRGRVSLRPLWLNTWSMGPTLMMCVFGKPMSSPHPPNLTIGELLQTQPGTLFRCTPSWIFIIIADSFRFGVIVDLGYPSDLGKCSGCFMIIRWPIGRFFITDNIYMPTCEGKTSFLQIFFLPPQPSPPALRHPSSPIFCVLSASLSWTLRYLFVLPWDTNISPFFSSLLHSRILCSAPYILSASF